MKHTIYFVFLAAMIGCNNHNPVSTQQQPSNNQIAIDGVWQENFLWLANPVAPGISQASLFKTSTLSIQSGIFKVSILPPHTVIVPPNSVSTLSSDTSYSGTYSLSSGRIEFDLNGDDVPVRFLIQAQGDSLNLVGLSSGSVDTLGQFFLWGHSIQKYSGVFKRAN